jgi:hypothetical protein
VSVGFVAQPPPGVSVSGGTPVLVIAVVAPFSITCVTIWFVLLLKVFPR